MRSNCKKECAERHNWKPRGNIMCKGLKQGNPAIHTGDIFKITNNIVSSFRELEPELVSNDPPIIVFDKFLNNETIEAFLNYGAGKYKRSTGLLIEDGKYKSTTTEIRTSQNTWCQTNECINNIHIQNMTEQISAMLNIPSLNFEFAQMLYYFPCIEGEEKNCSFYKRHHDFIQEDTERMQGPRIFTLFMYLNDVDKGGFTVFDANISVQPKKGRAVLWPNVLDSNVFIMDHRTHHEAKPVFSGEKFAVNFWIHMYDFKTPFSRGCSR